MGNFVNEEIISVKSIFVFRRSFQMCEGLSEVDYKVFEK